GDCIEWADLDGNVLGTGNELCVMPPVGVSQYIAGVPGLDCITSDTVTVMVDTVPPVLPPNIPDTVLLCLNDMTTVEVGDYDYPFIWQDENGDTVAVNEDLVLTGDMAGTTSFVFEATNGCGTVADTLIQVTIDSADIEILPSVDTLVVCDSLAIQLEGFAPLGQAVVWTDGNGTVIDTAVVIEIIPEPGSMTYIASSVELGCVRSDTIVVEYVPEDLSVEITASSILICLGDEVDLEATLDPEGVSATITWYDENFEFIDEGDATTVTPIRSGFVSYFAVAENACAMDTASIEIEVEELDLAIVGGDTSICSGDFATLEVVGCDDCTYEWTPEDRLTDPMAAITDASPLRPSTYQVVVTGEVCRDTLTTSVDVGTCERCEVDKVFIADAFTPNGDQNNDFVCIRSEVMEQFSEIELMIYNRWGQEVFRSNSMDNLCWDGSFDGEALAPDVYGYFLRIVCPGEEGEPDQVFNRQGNITLLR
ncbi:MAG: gliding motility-associated C-terminal domain-containing protein, partial [Phaeodactylibacter sp.]|uniref:gliding motility-associated C-terminal domain-containing protein n=1 Tax=Phaeodactylibacter sp. TaxID=1940289 RepID=UPI0032EDE63A